MFDTTPNPNHPPPLLSELAQAMPLVTSLFSGPPASCYACGAALEPGSTTWQPEDSDVFPWTFCYSCGAGLMLLFSWLDLADVAAIPYYGGGSDLHQLHDLPDDWPTSDTSDAPHLP